MTPVENARRVLVARRDRGYKRRTRAARRLLGACHWCWSPATTGGFCAEHYAKNAARNALRRSA